MSSAAPEQATASAGRLDRAARVALVGLAIAGVGALGPWSTGTLSSGLTLSDRRSHEVWGLDSTGPLMLVLLLGAAACILWLRRPGLRKGGAFGAAVVVGALALVLLPTGGSITFLASYDMETLRWGLPVVVIGSGIAAYGSLRLPRSPTG